MLWVRLGMVAMLIPTAMYYWALGKNVSDLENKKGKDMSYDVNPFTGEEVITDEEKLEK